MKYLIAMVLIFSQIAFSQTSDEGVLKVGSLADLLRPLTLTVNQKYYSFQDGRQVVYGSEDQNRAYCTLFQRAGNTVVNIPPQSLLVSRSIRREMQGIFYDAFTFESNAISGLICWGQNGQPPTLLQVQSAFGSYFRF